MTISNPTKNPAPRSSLPIWISLGLLVLTLVVGETTPLDFALQDHLYDPATQAWLVDALAPVPRLFFYDGPKVVIIALGVALIVLLAGPARWRTRLGLDRARLAAAVAVMAVVPAFVGFIKARSDVFCPAQLTRYGGTQEHRRPFTPRPPEEQAGRRGHCWPAGHASGGFALVGLALLARTREGRRIGLAVGLAAGWTMGAYQILKGAHFLSHTLVTMFVAVLFTAILARCLPPPAESGPDPAI
jgi:membrane-associated PAP2 superfamily phosphatase